MSILAEDLVEGALFLLDPANTYSTKEIDSRRAVSAAYYAFFHKINGDAVALLAPHVSVQTNHRIQRWFDHVEMKRVCGRFVAASLSQPLLDLIGASASPDLQTVARAFIELQEARHSADYDLSYQITYGKARLAVELAIRAIAAWDRLAGSAEANIFILSLLLWKNWERERP